MGFKQADSEGRGGYARVWEVENKGNYSVVKLNTSKKNKEGSYETDFQDGFVRFIGTAHEKIKDVSLTKKGVGIQIKSCDVTNTYDPEKKKTYINYLVFAFDFTDSEAEPKKDSKKPAKAAKKTTRPKEEEDEVNIDDDDLPF